MKYLLEIFSTDKQQILKCKNPNVFAESSSTNKKESFNTVTDLSWIYCRIHDVHPTFKCCL